MRVVPHRTPDLTGAVDELSRTQNRSTGEAQYVNKMITPKLYKKNVLW